MAREMEIEVYEHGEKRKELWVEIRDGHVWEILQNFISTIDASSKLATNFFLDFRPTLRRAQTKKRSSAHVHKESGTKVRSFSQ